MHFSFSGRGHSVQAWLIEQILGRVIAFKEVDMQSYIRSIIKDAEIDRWDVAPTNWRYIAMASIRKRGTLFDFVNRRAGISVISAP